MIAAILIWAIIFLGILDLIILTILLIHHFYTYRSRIRWNELKNQWALFLQKIIDTGKYDNVVIDSPRDYLVIAETLRFMPGINKPNAQKNISIALERLGYVDFYLKRLNSRWWWIRAEAAIGLGEVNSDQVLHPLTKALDDRALNVRLKAATALAMLQRPDAVTKLAENLPSLGFVSMEWLKDLFYLILRDKPEFLKDLLTTIDEPLVKKSLVEVVGELGVYETQPLAVILDEVNEDLEVKISVIKSLGQLKAEVPALEKALTSEDWEMRAIAAKSLGEVGDPASIPSLKERLSDRNWWVRINSAHALLKMGKAGIDELQNNLTAKDNFARDISKQALGEAKMIKVGSSHG